MKKYFFQEKAQHTISVPNKSYSMNNKMVEIMALESKQSVTLHDCHEQISKTVFKIW